MTDQLYGLESGTLSEDEVAKARDAIAGEMPVIRPADDPVVRLPRGIFDLTTRTFLTDAMVHELTGADEEAIARMMGGTDALPFLNAVLTHGVDSIGTRDLSSLPIAERMGVIDGLLVGEKEMLFLQILKVTYGDEREITLKCPTCGEDNEVTFSLTDDIPIKTMEDPQRVTYEYDLRTGEHIEYRLVTGADQAETQKRRNITLPESNTILLSRCVITINGKPPVDPLRFAREMGALDRRNLLNEIVGKQPGPQFEEVKLPCASCGAESTFTPAWADLLQP